jgi:hypothetical protein
MSHVSGTGSDLTGDSADAVGTFIATPATHVEPAGKPRAIRLALFAATALQALLPAPRSHEHWRRHRHDSGCACGHCARWRHVERHGPRGRRGGGEI